jgi:hypothetical protein
MHLLRGSSKHVRVILPQMPPTPRTMPCTSPLIREKPTFRLPMDGSTNSRHKTVYRALLDENRSLKPESVED